MNETLLKELIGEVRESDISERYREIVHIVGIQKFAELSNYARGDELYFPKVESVVAPARNRRIKKEYDGSNEKVLAAIYNLTVKQIWSILRDEPPVGQMSMDEVFGKMFTDTTHPE